MRNSPALKAKRRLDLESKFDQGPVKRVYIDQIYTVAFPDNAETGALVFLLKKQEGQPVDPNTPEHDGQHDSPPRIIPSGGRPGE